MNLDIFKHKLPIIIRYDDLDTYGHVNNKIFLSFLEDARIYFMKDIMGFAPKNLDFEAVVGRIDIKYLVPLHLYDEVFVYSRCSKVGEKSYELEHFITKKVEDKEIACAFCTVTMVSYDLKNGVSKINNPKMIEKIMEYEIEKPIMK